MAKTTIEWTDASWNPTTGCTKISEGCDNCYAERIALRLQKMGQKNYRNGFELTIHEHMLSLPSKWKTPRMVFVNSMSDIFHNDIPEKFIKKTFGVMNAEKRHIFQVLTKRSHRLLKISNKLTWSDNIWMGVTIESDKYIYRKDNLVSCEAKVKFLSLEPLLSSLRNIDLKGINWVIVGGESGPKARPIKKEWITEIRDKCISQSIPFFFKQWGGINKKKSGRLLDGKIWNQFPDNISLTEKKMVF